MQKLYRIFIFSSVLSVVQSSCMEQLPKDVSLSCGIDKKIMWKFVDASHEGNAKKFIDDNPYIINAWVEPFGPLSDPYTLLHCMVERDKIPVVQALLQAGAHAHSNTPTEWRKHTPLHMVRSKEMAVLLLRYGAKLESADKDGNTPLSDALFDRSGLGLGHCGHFCSLGMKSEGLAEYLLQQGADTNVVDKDGYSLLHRAVREHDNSCIPLLIQYGADVEIKDKEGHTPYDCAFICGKYLDERTLNSFRSANILFISEKFFKGNCTSEYEKSNMNAKIKDLLVMAAQNYNVHKPSKIIHYDTKGYYCFNNVSLVDLAELVYKV